MNAKRNALSACTAGDNPGLILARYLGEAAGADKTGVARNALRNAAISALGKTVEFYRLGYKRWLASLPDKPKELITTGRIMVGLGNDNVLEAGISLNHIYGVPYIPGSSLKGLAAHYCHTIWGAKKPEFLKDGEWHNIIFGNSKSAGHIAFYDAWITPDTVSGSLCQDIMTCHHQEYYTGSGSKPPSDYDSPIPVHFFSAKGTFAVLVRCESEGAESGKWSALAYELLREALREWGVGGKTSSGYGRMSAE